jgi:hypothetical protein
MVTSVLRVFGTLQDRRVVREYYNRFLIGFGRLRKKLKSELQLTLFCFPLKDVPFSPPWATRAPQIYPNFGEQPGQMILV